MRGKRSRYRKNPRKIDAIVDELCSKLGMDEVREHCRAVDVWKEMVGETVASETFVERLSEGRLFVRVTSAVWRTELNFRKRELAERINLALGRQAVREIVFR